MSNNQNRLTFEQVRALHAAGELARAKNGYLDLLREKPDDVESLHFLAILLAEEGDLFAALDYLNRACAIEPSNPSLQLHLANLYKANQEVPRAIEILEALVQKQPRFAPAYNNLGTLYYSLSQWEAAESVYGKAIDLQPNYIDAYYNLALALIKQGKVKQATQYLHALLELNSKHPAAKFHLACLYMQQNDYIEASKLFEEIVSVHQFHAETQLNLGTCYFQMKEYKQAEHHYKNAQELFPNDLQILFNLAIIAEQEREWQTAMQFYQQIVDIQPNYFPARHNLAILYLQQNDKENALHHFRQAQQIEPNNQYIQHIVAFLGGDQNVKAAPKEYIKVLFDHYADHYDQHMLHALSYSVPKQLYAVSMPFLPAAADILDIGCGTGLMGEHLKKHIKSLTGVDLSANMLAIAAKRRVYDQLIESEIMDYLSNVTINSFDAIFAADVIEYFGDLTLLISNIANILRSSGYFIFNIEISSHAAYELTHSGRFAHQDTYIRQVLAENQLHVVVACPIILRLERRKPVEGMAYVVSKGAILSH